MFASRFPGLDTIKSLYNQADFFLVECGKGRLPGGNAETWDYGLAQKTAYVHPVFLAGGLSCDNIDQATTLSGRRVLICPPVWNRSRESKTLSRFQN